MSTLNPSAIPGLDVFEHDPRPRPLPVPEVREIWPESPSLRQRPLPVPEVREFERIDPKTLKPMMSGPGMQQPPLQTPAAAASPQSPTGGWMRRTAQTLREANGYVNGTANPGPVQPAASTGLRGAVGTAGRAVAPVLRGAGAAAAVIPGAMNTYDVAANKDTTKLDVATQAAEEVGKGASAWLGGQAGATAGAALGAATGPFAPVAIPAGAVVGGLAGGAAGYFGGEKVIKSLRGLTGTDPTSPAERITQLPTEPTASGPASAPAGKVWPGAGGLPSYKDATRASTPGFQDPRVLQGAFDRNRDNPNYDGLHSDMSGALATVPRDLPDLNAGRVYKTKDANGRTVYSGRDVQDGAKIVDGRGAITGQLNTSAAPPSAGGNSFDRELTSLRELGAARAAADPGWGGGVGSMGPSLRDMARRNAETTASSIDPRTARRGERQLDGMDKQDIANTQAGAQRYGADAGLRGTMYAADARLKGDLAQSQANTLRTQMEMNFKNGNRALMAQIYQQSGGKLDVAKKMALANGLDPQVFEQALAGDQAAEAKNQTIQGNAVDRVREDLKVYVPGKDGGPPVEDKAASQAQLDLMRRLFPGITGTDPAYYEANKAKIAAMAGIFQAARQNRGIGLREFTPFANDPQGLTEMPKWKGATISRTDGLRGATTTNLDRGEHVLKTADGKEINLGALDDTQVDLIRKHAKTGEWE